MSHPATRRTSRRYYASAACLVSSAAASLYSRKWRDEKLQTLQEAELTFIPKADGAVTTSTKAKQSLRRDLNELAVTVERTGLMGTSVPGAKSVKHELQTIRKWHQDRGFVGGLVLRELTQPLFEATWDMDEDEIEGGDDVEPIPHHELLQRECYYLYYELRPNGETKQQIFCRGTTLLADVKTCVNMRMVYDQELQCSIHRGFRDHADRLLCDVLPLLAAASNRRATVEVCGHSLGGAVAFIVAMKLKKRGYNVRRVTAVAAPRFCDTSALDKLSLLLPRDSLRIEDDFDPVPYLPPMESGLGDKLWFTNLSGGRQKAYFVPFRKDNEWWLDSAVLGLRVEALAHLNRTHRIPSYVSKIKDLSKKVKRLSSSKESTSAELSIPPDKSRSA